jgi:membrane fusion protein, heavy metal efflux system
MTGESRVSVHPGVAALAAAAFILVGVAGTYLALRGRPTSPQPPHDSVPVAPVTMTSSTGGPLPDVTITLTPDAVARAGLVIAPVTSATTASSIRIPGTVEPNAYKQVTVTPLVAGRVIRVASQLGDRVRQGQTMAQIYSPELAEAETRYIAVRAMLQAHDRELQRTQKLVEIGAASRQELERLHAEHATQLAEVESARARLQLLGVPASDTDNAAAGKAVSATTSVPAPRDGIVTERLANVGVNVDTATKLFTVVDLSTVWVVADLYEKDFGRVRVGSSVEVTTPAYPDLVVQGSISYIAPQVSNETRTAKVRVEVPNSRGMLRLGMYADVTIAAAEGKPALAIPAGAVQNVGDRTVVYLRKAKNSQEFIEREVRLGASAGGLVEVLSGLRADDLVVSEGSFLVRAERERLGLRPAETPGPGAAGKTSEGARAPAVQTVRVTVTDAAFEPSRLRLHAGVPARVTFVRMSGKTCATEVTFPALHLKRSLPLNQPVVVEFTPSKGALAFACGVGMLKGSVVAE